MSARRAPTPTCPGPHRITRGLGQLNQAESLLYSAERALFEFGAVLEERDRAALETDLVECRRAVETGTIDQVKAALLRLESSAQKIGELLYAQAGGDGTA